MRYVRTILLAGSALCAQPAIAADALKFGTPPAWVTQQPIPAAKPTDAPVAILLRDEQIAFGRGTTTTYSEVAFKIQNPQGLDAGNLSVVWQPSTDSVTVNKVQIRRGDKVIDVLAAGQTFTVLRRETNLDAATLDGTLTATIQPEDLQEGDIVDFATTTESSDPVLKGHVEAIFGVWDALPMQSAHAKLSWPSSLHVVTRESSDLPPARRSTAAGTAQLELSAANVEPVIAPKGAPQRFAIGRIGEATDFASWADLANLFIPLFRDASVIPASGPLHDEVEKIRASSSDPKQRAQQALALVENRVRYVALLMGRGGYVPANADTTWSRRFADCKGKTALLLGMLHSLGIEAEPVLVQSKVGDVVADRLPMVSLFDHVLVRAHIGGKAYWLDGTRTGDTDLDSLAIPNFGWGLPLVANAQLVHIVPAPLDVPGSDMVVDIDATDGVYAPARVTGDETVRGDEAVATQAQLSALSEAQRQQAFQFLWASLFDFANFKSGAFTYDKAKRELHLTMTGDGKLDWSDGYFHMPDSSVSYRPKFDRQPGPFHDAPIALDYPNYNKSTVRLHVPPHFFATRNLGSTDVHETLAGVEYSRTASVSGNVLTVTTSTRSIVPEVPYKDAVAAAPRMAALSDEDVSLPLPSDYNSTVADVEALKSDPGAGEADLVNRGNMLLGAGKNDDAITLLTKALSLNPKDAIALADRGIAFANKSDRAAAEKDFAAAEAIDPANAVLWRGRAIMAEADQNISGAIADYSKSLEIEPANSFALAHRAILYAGNDQYDLALKDVARILAADPKNLLALVVRAGISIDRKDYAAAAKDLDSARSINADNPALIEAEAKLASAQGDTAREIAAYSRIIELGPDKARAYAARAEAYRDAERFPEALADSEAALKLGDTDPYLRVTRANIFKQQGKDEAVAIEAEAMMRENPKSTLAMVAAGKSFAAIDRDDKAMDAFSRALAIAPAPYIYENRENVRPRSDFSGRLADIDAALKMDPTDKDALSAKVGLLSDKGDDDAALALFDATPGLAQDMPGQRAKILAHAGRTAEAEKVLEKMRAEATTPTQLNNVCWTKATLGLLLESALQDCRDALKAKPGNGAYLDSLGMVLLKLGKLDEALEAYDQSIAKETGESSLMGRAFVYLRKGDRVRADADAAAARRVSARVDETFARYGLKWDNAAAGAKTAALHH